MNVKILMAGLVCAMLGLSACSSGSEATTEPGSGGGPTLTIESPTEGAEVTNPVTLKFSSNEEIDKEETGKHHVHVVVDGKTNDYTVVTSTTYQLEEDLPPGKHTIGVTLQHADHSDAGAAAEVNVNVTGGSGGSDGGGSDGGGGIYDY